MKVNMMITFEGPSCLSAFHRAMFILSNEGWEIEEKYETKSNQTITLIIIKLKRILW